jgi:hypothetical protein
MNANRTVSCWLLLMIFSGTLSGCATIVSGRKTEVTLDNSGGATYFSVLDNNNRVVDSGVTPKQVTLPTTQTWLTPAKYHVVYASQDGVEQYNLNAGFNWWTAGNIIIGGVPGIAIDAATGALWKLQPQVIGHVPEQRIVSSESQGAALVASHMRSGPVNGNFVNANTPQSHVQQASFSGLGSAVQPNQSSEKQPPRYDDERF